MKTRKTPPAKSILVWTPQRRFEPRTTRIQTLHQTLDGTACHRSYTVLSHRLILLSLRHSILTFGSAELHVLHNHDTQLQIPTPCLYVRTRPASTWRLQITKSSATGCLPVSAFSFLVGSLCFRTLLMTYTNIYNARTRSLMRHQNWDDKHALLVLWSRCQMQHCKSICILFNDNIYCRVKRRLETRLCGQLIKPSVLLEVHEFSSLCVSCYKIQWRKHTSNMLIQVGIQSVYITNGRANVFSPLSKEKLYHRMLRFLHTVT